MIPTELKNVCTWLNIGRVIQRKSTNMKLGIELERKLIQDGIVELKIGRMRLQRNESVIVVW